MASACVNKIGMSPEKFMDCPPTAAKWWMEAKRAQQPEKKKEFSDPGSPVKEFADFEFRLEDPVNILPADELFSDGKLIPTQLPFIRATVAAPPEMQPDTPSTRRRCEVVSGVDPFLFSPKAPRCSSRWKEILGLKKLNHNSAKQPPPENQKTTSSNSNNRSLKHFLHTRSKTSSFSSSSPDSTPLLAAADGAAATASARLSLSSSSSSGHDHDDLPRLSLDSDKQRSSNLHRIRLAKTRLPAAPERLAAGDRLSGDSPRINASGKIIFHSLERSSSSPSTFNGAPRYKYRGMERSYSANVRVTPVLNVPVCRSSKSGGVFGFPLFSSSSSSSSASSYSSYQQKKEKDGCNGSSIKNNRT